MIIAITYLLLIASIWLIYRFGFYKYLKSIVSVVVPSVFIILFNIKAGRMLFRNPLVGIISFLPTAIFVFKLSQPLVDAINNFIDKIKHNHLEMEDLVDVEVISKENAD